MSYLSEFVHFGSNPNAPVSKQVRGRQAFTTLAKLADKEDWGPHLKILFNYMDSTFSRICQLDREGGNYLVYSPATTQAPAMQNACFNTGLYTAEWAPIFCLMSRAAGYDESKAGSREYAFNNFLQERDIMNLQLFNKLPPPPIYFNNPFECFYDCRVPIKENLVHIMSADHQARVVKAFPEFNAKTKSEQASLIRDSIAMAKLRCASNIRTVVPQYYRHKIQLLMPLSIEGHVRVVLVLEKRQNVANTPADHSRPEDWFYDASTILSLDMAYNNARLIFRIESEWLSACEPRGGGGEEEDLNNMGLMLADVENDSGEGDEGEEEGDDREEKDPIDPRIRPLAYCMYCKQQSPTHPRGKCPAFRPRGNGDNNRDDNDDGEEEEEKELDVHIPGGWGIDGRRGGYGAGPVAPDLVYCVYCKQQSPTHPRGKCPAFRPRLG